MVGSGEITNSKLQKILYNYFTGVPTELPESVEELENLELTSREGKYKIKVGEIYKGELNQNAGELKKGQKVEGSNAEWLDETNEYPAIIPVGFCIVTDAGTIEEGLVISDVENDDMENK